MRALVTYYSRTGITHAVAESLAATLGADLEAIRDGKDRSGVIGFVTAGKEASLRQMPPIEAPEHDPAGYDLVVIGTPVWAGTMASPVRTWLSTYGPSLKTVAYFCTTGHTSREKTLNQMAALAGRPARASLGLLEKDVKKGRHADEVATFGKALQAPPEGDGVESEV